MWTHFEPGRTEGNLESGKGMGTVFIHGYIAGRVPNRDPGKKVWLSLGLHWNTPLFRETPAVAVAQCWFDGGASLVDTFRRGVIGTMPGAEMIDGIVALWRALKANDTARIYQLSLPITALIWLQNSLDAFERQSVVVMVRAFPVAKSV